MRLDLTEVCSTNGASKTFTNDEVFGNVLFDGSEYVFDKPSHAELEVTNLSGTLTLKGTVSGTFTVPCARCGVETRQPFFQSISEVLTREENKGSEDEVVFSGSSIEVKDLLLNSILMQLSNRYLCKEDCKGLCPMCGVNRNREACGCDLSAESPFGVLKGLKL